MRRYILLLIILTLTIPISVFAFISGDGDKYTAEYNNNGAVLTSEHDKYFVENNASGNIKVIKLKLYLGVSCDAYSEIYGKGTWGWANGGFSIEFENKTFGFARQSIKFPGAEKCQL